jgi:hypothetical protein
MDPVNSVDIASRPVRGRRLPALFGAFVVVLTVVVLMVLLVPRPNAVVRPTVDVAVVADQARVRLGFDPSVPRNLPEGWIPVQAQVKEDSGGTLTWHVGYVADGGDFVGYVQAVDPPQVWENTQVISGPETEVITVGGNDWIRRDRVDRGVTSYVLRGDGGVETIVSGSTDVTVVETLVRALDLPAEG